MEEAATASTDVIPPFTGNTIPMHANKESPTAPQTAPTTSSSTATTSPSYAAAAAAFSKPARPIKSQTKPTYTLDVAFVKKKLFIPSNHRAPLRNPDGGHKNATNILFIQNQNCLTPP